MDVSKISLSQAREALWTSGVLTWKLRTHQTRLYESYKNCKDKIIVWNCSRRLGKSSVLCLLALETCLKKPNSLVKYACAKKKDAKEIIRPLLRDLIEDCPIESKPEFKTQENVWLFPNGSRIQLNGLDGGTAESIRGGSSDLCIIDEAGLVKDLPYIMNSILLPTTLTTKGKIILASTPPRSPSHPYITQYLNRARIEGNLVTMTVRDNPYIDDQELDIIINQYHDKEKDPEFRREYMAEIIIDDNYAIIPEFTKYKENIVKEWKRAPFYDGYVAMDIGVKDLTVVLFGWFDFLSGKIIVEDEFVLNGQKFNTNSLADGIKQKEKDTFSDRITGEQLSPFLRVSDTTLTVLNDLFQTHSLRFLPTRKDEADAALNNVRVMMQNEKIVINPRCKTLIMHLESGVWNKNKTSYERSADAGHYDAIDALKYLVRAINITKNPYPAGFLDRSNYNEYKMQENQHKDKDTWLKVFNVNKPSKTEKSKEIVKILNTRIKRW
jgi:PBSX family phage terminase large subunit